MLAPWLVFVLIGGIVGLASTYLGVGGGVLIMPSLPIVVDWPYREILATCHLTVVLVVSRNLWVFLKKRLVPWPVVLMTGPSAALSAYFAGSATRWVDERVLIFIFILVLAAMSVKTWSIQPLATHFVQGKNFKRSLILVLGALAGGFLAGLTGVGAGMIMIPLIMSSGLVMDKQLAPAANGTLLFATVFALLPLLMEGSWSYQRWGLAHVDVSLVLWLGSLVTSTIGHRFQSNFPPLWRKRIVAGLLSVLTVQLVYRKWALLLSFMSLGRDWL